VPDIPRRRDIDGILAQLTSGKGADVITAHIHVPAREARLEDFPDWLAPKLADALRGVGIEQLYRHQRLAVDAVRRGEDVVVVTPTASGKSLCYNLPVLQTILEDPRARAFYLFPTKALSQDQVGSLQSVIDNLGVPVRTFTYDGDTPADARTAVRTRGHVIVTNPDMLHAGILPNHPRWRKVLQDLRYIVVDEMHTYRGVFGSHVANVMRRLLRLCAFYGSRPQIICSSATIANPREHAERLLERKVTLISAEENGAPAGPKEYIFVNPPVINEELGIRKGVLSQARKMAGPFIEQRIPTICFTGSRLHTEVLARYLRERFCRRPGTGGLVASYRGGYLPALRRKIEAGLRDGDITCVVSTNALELGIDIGRLDVAILAGYPGSVASTFQQGGRAGRGDRRSIVLLIARNTPLDQFVIRHPEYLFDRAPEHARIDPDNLMVLIAHVKCGLYELPFNDGETFGGENLGEMLDFLVEAGCAHKLGDKWHWREESYPADGVSLRSSDPENVVIIDTSAGDRVIAETDRLSAQTTVHEGAIYMVESRPYQVDHLDWEQQKAYVRQVDVDHYTTAMSYSKVRVLDCFESEERVDGGLKAHGEVHVARKTVGYKKIKLYTSDNVGYGDVHLPDLELHTMGWWLSLDGEPLRAAGYRGLDVVDGLLGLGSALRSLAALHLMCDLRDLGLSLADPEDAWVAGLERGGRRVVRDLAPDLVGEGRPRPLAALQLQRPTLFLYDNMPGGVGFSEKIFEITDLLLREARELIVSCVCDNGCPSCVGPIGEVEQGARLAAVDLADWLSGRIPRPRGPEGAAEVYGFRSVHGRDREFRDPSRESMTSPRPQGDAAPL
jgi:DEAD/DEAH box helicase domain-containing protein